MMYAMRMRSRQKRIENLVENESRMAGKGQILQGLEGVGKSLAFYSK